MGHDTLMLYPMKHRLSRIGVVSLIAAAAASFAQAQGAREIPAPARRPAALARGVQDGSASRDARQANARRARPPRQDQDRPRAGDRPTPRERERMRRAAGDGPAARDARPDRPGRDPLQRFARRSGIRGDLTPDELDHRPLDEGEAPQLMEFARGHFPEVHQRLEQMARRNPEEFRRQLQRFAPRLRFIKRLQQEHPRLARIMLARIDNEQRIQRYRRAWDNADAPTRRRILREARERIADNLRLESEVLRLRVQRVRESLEQRVERWFAHLVKPGSDLADEPPAIREQVDRIHAAPAEQRPALEDDLRDRIAAEMEDELAAIEERLRHRDERRAEEVDQRVRRLFGVP